MDADGGRLDIERAKETARAAHFDRPAIHAATRARRDRAPVHAELDRRHDGHRIVALAINQLPLPAPGLLHAIGQSLWLFNIALFVAFSSLYAARWILEAGLRHHVAIDLPARSFSAIRHRERHQSAAATALLAEIRNA